MSKEYIRKDDNLLKLAQNIFGKDIVVDAFSVYCNYDEETIENGMFGSVESEEDNVIDVDGDEIRLVFCNGKIVHFSTSEWGTLQPPYKDTEYCEI